MRKIRIGDTLKKLKDRIRPETTEREEQDPLVVVAEPEKEERKLYACEWCGELFEASLYPGSCPQCGRAYTDSVKELDTGRVFGGRPVIREASVREAEAYYRLREKGEKRRIRTDRERTEY